MITIEVNSEEVIKDLEKYLKRVTKQIPQQIDKTGLRIRTLASAKAPIDKNRLKPSITYARAKPFEGKVFTRVAYAGFQEFGIGAGLNIPQGAEKAAQEYKGKGLRKVNMRAQPFMFPAAESYRKEFIQQITRILK